MGPMVFNFLNDMPTRTSTAVITWLQQASLFFRFFWQFLDFFGRIFFSPRANNILGAPTTSPEREERVALTDLAAYGPLSGFVKNTLVIFFWQFVRARSRL